MSHIPVLPNTTVQFYTDIGLDSGYENTLYFPSELAKDSYFSTLASTSKYIATVSSMTYQRTTKASFRVGKKMSELLGAGYIRFRNGSFENKWYYAFVDNIEYVNNETTEVYYTLDVMMTWMGSFELGECLVERQHVTHDEIGNNIADEGLEVGNYITEYEKRLVSTDNMKICLAYADFDEEGQGGGSYGGIYSAIDLYATTDPDEMTAYIRNMVGATLSKNIVSLFMSPADYTFSGMGNVPFSYDHNIDKPYSTIGGIHGSTDAYVPRNKKLFCYPYKYLTIENSEGDVKDFMYEYFNTLPDETSAGKCYFRTYGITTTRPEISLVPIDYKGAGKTVSGKIENWTERMSMVKFPVCAWTSDNYSAYLAMMNSNETLQFTEASAGGAMSGAIRGMLNGGLVGAGTGAVVGATSGALMEATNMFARNLIRPERGTDVHGNQDSDILSAVGAKNFVLSCRCITKNYAMMLDNYFDMYGYTIKQVIKPNMCVRKYWTFIKTVGSKVSGLLPSDHGKLIESILDNGIRFWNTQLGSAESFNIDNIGNYSALADGNKELASSV